MLFLQVNGLFLDSADSLNSKQALRLPSAPLNSWGGHGKVQAKERGRLTALRAQGRVTWVLLTGRSSQSPNLMHFTGGEVGTAIMMAGSSRAAG